jgi:hypothetical protein
MTVHHPPNARMTSAQLRRRLRVVEERDDTRVEVLNRDERLRLVEDLCLRRWTSEDIAEELGISRDQVLEDLQALVPRWGDRSRAGTPEIRAQEVAALDRLEREYWDAWSRSQQPKVTRRVRTRGRDTEQSIETTEQTGDPRFLAGVLGCIEKRTRLLGVEAPEMRIFGVRPVGGSTEQTEIESRLTRYEGVILGLVGGRGASQDAGLDAAQQPVDTDGPAPEAGEFLDVPGTDREDSA